MNIRPSDILHSLADETGGKQISNNEPAMSLREVVKNASAFYLLGYLSAKNPADGKFHKIAVKVKRPGVEVRARSGYFAPSLTDDGRGQEEGRGRRAAPEISKALSTLVDAPHMPSVGDLWAGAGARAGWHAARDAGVDAARWRGRPLSRVRASGRRRAGVFRGTAAREPHGVRRGARSGQDAPQPGGPRRVCFGQGRTRRSRCRISPPRRSRSARRSCSARRTPLQLRAIQAEPDPQPFAGRQFERNDRILLRFGVFGSSAKDATVTAALLSRQGAKLATMPLQTTAAGHYEIDLPIGSVARGDYVFEIVASHGADQAKTLVSFRVN